MAEELISTVSGHIFTTNGDSFVIPANPRRTHIKIITTNAQYPYWGIWLDTPANGTLIGGITGFSFREIEYSEKDFGDLVQHQITVKLNSHSAGTAGVCAIETFRSKVSGG